MDTFVAVPPDVAAGRLSRPIEQSLLRGREQLVAVREALSTTAAVYQQQSRNDTSVRLLRGSEVIRDTLRRLDVTCRGEVQAVQPGGPRPPHTLEETLGQLLAIVTRGVRHRTIYQHTVRTHTHMLDFMREVHTAGGRFRTTEALFDRMTIYDRTVALIADQRDERTDHALLIEHPGITGFLAGVFDHAWDSADPVDFAPYARPAPLTDEKRITVLRLMVDGHTDAAISARLGMSPRTVATYIKKTAEEVGSRSRAQLAYLLARTAHLEPLPGAPPTTM
ncbi:LuxR C-terminal-related transcriptional regulator [Streptomyces sp. NPDC058434]|uniref:LuxR C-terminal-related transcriptional regulator n=1 Tax=Streptomyces sp. NPDC058434 TaxID=3346498 RepID=UPI003657F301